MSAEVTLAMAAWRPRVDWLRAAVESALGQRGCELELLLVDDGSPEPVAPLVEDVGDPRLRVVRIEHAGEAAAKNAAIEHARTPYIRFVDCDDVVEADSTARLLALVAGREDVVAYGSTVVCDAELRPLRTISSTLEGDVVEACLLGRFDARHVSMVFPLPLVRRAGGWSTSFEASADWDFTIRVLEHATVRADPNVATYYRRHGESIMGLASVALGEADRLRMVEGFFERHPELRGSRLERRAMLELRADRALAYAHAGEPLRAFQRLAQAARLSPRRGLALLPSLLRTLARRGRRQTASVDTA